MTLAILPFLVGRTAARPRAWVAMAVVSLALGLASFAIGGYAQRACTARYRERSVVIGTDLTALGGFTSCRHCGLEDRITDIAVRYFMPLCCELSGLMLS